MGRQLLLAQTSTVLEETDRVIYELARLKAFDDPRWVVVALAAACLLLAAFVWWMVRRDAAELRPWVRWSLAALRIIALAGLVLYFLHLEKRSVQEIVHNSRVVILIDTSQSMGVRDVSLADGSTDASRADQIANLLQSGTLLRDLRQKHDVTVIRFDSQNTRLATFGKIDPNASQTAQPGDESAAAPANLEGDPSTEDNLTVGDNQAADAPPEEIVWQELIAPQGTESRLGEALRNVVNDERDSPIAGIIVLTDGAQNAGLDPAAAVRLASDAEIPIYTIGMGTDERPRNVRVGDVLAPARAYPGDMFTVTASVQSQGFANRALTVELYSRDAGNQQAIAALESSRRVTLGGDSEVTPVTFEVSPDAIGRRTYAVRISAPSEDRNPTDNQFEVDVDIVDQETRVLLIAGGPTREYRFLRNQLYRDSTFLVDVILQTAQPGISQDADNILDEFPSTKEDLYQYDCIAAFDPDWEALAADQIDLLEQWVAEEAGGIVVIAGPINTGKWTRESRMNKLKALYPVEFQQRISLFTDSVYGTTTPWPLDFSREGLDAEFLWIEDEGGLSSQAWRQFAGVYGHYAVRGAKPGATVFARFSDPAAAQGGEAPVFFAEHIYGAGRVFYIGSGEMWRLRSDSVAYFERFYTKLIRHVSQGRLLRGSSRGLLLVDRDRYLLGDTVTVRAQLSDAQHEPLADPSVVLQVTQPEGAVQSVVMSLDPARPGAYRGQFTALREGAYRMDLPLPDAIDEQLTRRIQVRVPDLERENPQRNDALLTNIARPTGGLYYVGIGSALGEGGAAPLVSQLRDRTEITRLLGSPDQDFKERMMYGLLALVCGALFLEWLIRRLSKLA